MSQYKEDHKLLDLIKTGDESAFRELFDKYYNLLCYSAFKVYRDEHKAKDFAQEVFLDLWRRRETIQIKISLQAFLRRAVVNKTIDYIRSQRFDFEQEVEVVQNKVENPDDLEFSELQNLIHRVVDKLPERCRIIFTMSRFEGMSHKEIAKKLNISEKTIENQITKALKILRNVINQYGGKLKILLIYFLFN